MTECITLFGMDENAQTFTRVMRFIAFAYTYHYLNWFTKTRVIGWADILRRRGLTIIGRSPRSGEPLSVPCAVPPDQRAARS